MLERVPAQRTSEALPLLRGPETVTRCVECIWSGGFGPSQISRQSSVEALASRPH